MNFCRVEKPGLSRRSHKPEFAGSNPAPATNLSQSVRSDKSWPTHYRHDRGDRAGWLFRFFFPRLNRRTHRLGRLLLVSHREWRALL